MLKNALLYQDQLIAKYENTKYDIDRYKYYHTSYASSPNLQLDTWNSYDFVSVNAKTEVIGYISLSLSRSTYSVNNLCIISFHNSEDGTIGDHVVFGKDVVQTVEDIFLKYGFTKLSFDVIMGNPIEATYDKLVTEHGGRIVGIKKKEERLMDGKFYDKKLYEILKDDYIKLGK